MSAFELEEGRLWLGRETPGGSGADRLLVGPDGLRRLGRGSEELVRWADVERVHVEGEVRPDDLGSRLARWGRGVLDGVLELAAQGGAGATDREAWRFVAVAVTRRRGGPWRAGPRAVGDAGTSQADLVAAQAFLDAVVADPAAQGGLGDPDACSAAAARLEHHDVAAALAALRA